MSVKIPKYAGKEIGWDDIRKGRVLSVESKSGIRYSWSAGQAVGRFLEELKRGKIIARRCHKCRRVVVPPRMFCEWCFRPNDEWVYVKDTGAVNTFSVSHVATDASRLKEPIIPAVVEIDGCSPGVGFLHVLGEVDHKKVKIGMKVQAVWKPPREREGAITDIMYFKPMRR